MYTVLFINNEIHRVEYNSLLRSGIKQCKNKTKYDSAVDIAIAYELWKDKIIDIKVECIKFRAEVIGVGVIGVSESKWSSNSVEYETIEAAKQWLDGLALRWYGYIVSRVVPINTPTGQQLSDTQELYQDFRIK